MTPVSLTPGLNPGSPAPSGSVSAAGPVQKATLDPSGKVSDAEKSGVGSVTPRYDRNECQTCKNRKYKDGSDDPGVSFKTATRISPERAAGAVRAHEGEHVTREQAKASREGRKVVSQSVTYQTAICPECGKPYVAGGTTRTVTKNDTSDEMSSPKASPGQEKGIYLDTIA